MLAEARLHLLVALAQQLDHLQQLARAVGRRGDLERLVLRVGRGGLAPLLLAGLHLLQELLHRHAARLENPHPVLAVEGFDGIGLRLPFVGYLYEPSKADGDRHDVVVRVRNEQHRSLQQARLENALGYRRGRRERGPISEEEGPVGVVCLRRRDRDVDGATQGAEQVLDALVVHDFGAGQGDSEHIHEVWKEFLASLGEQPRHLPRAERPVVLAVPESHRLSQVLNKLGPIRLQLDLDSLRRLPA